MQKDRNRAACTTHEDLHENFKHFSQIRSIIRKQEAYAVPFINFLVSTLNTFLCTYNSKRPYFCIN